MRVPNDSESTCSEASRFTVGSTDNFTLVEPTITLMRKTQSQPPSSHAFAFGGPAVSDVKHLAIGAIGDLTWRLPECQMLLWVK